MSKDWMCDIAMNSTRGLRNKADQWRILVLRWQLGGSKGVDVWYMYMKGHKGFRKQQLGLGHTEIGKKKPRQRRCCFGRRSQNSAGPSTGIRGWPAGSLRHCRSSWISICALLWSSCWQRHCAPVERRRSTRNYCWRCLTVEGGISDRRRSWSWPRAIWWHVLGECCQRRNRFESCPVRWYSSNRFLRSLEYNSFVRRYHCAENAFGTSWSPCACELLPFQNLKKD